MPAPSSGLASGPVARLRSITRISTLFDLTEHLAGRAVGSLSLLPKIDARGVNCGA
jgi:hypothetical protein